MFERIVGHEEIKNMLEKSIKQDNISHAYLFEGPEGVGKKQLAMDFAKNILKTENLESCPDYTYIEKLEEKKDIVIDQIRDNLVNDVFSRPISGEKKVYIIDNAHLLNASAQNALLKTLEEPPKYAVIILVTNQVSSFLSTIISRVKKVTFTKLTKENMEKYISENNIQDVSSTMIDYVDGSISKLLSMNKDNLIVYNKLADIIQNIKNKNIAEILVEMGKDKIDLKEKDYLNYMQYTFYNKYKKEKIPQYLNVVSIIEKAKIRLKNNGNYDIVIDNMWIATYRALRS